MFLAAAAAVFLAACAPGHDPALYLAGCMAAGLWMRRYVRGVQDFAVAGREMDVNLGIASLLLWGLRRRAASPVSA